MKNILNKFDEQIESIFNMKQEFHEDDYITNTYFHHVLSFIIILSICLGIGYLTNINPNFNYVALSINAAIFGSFLFALLYKEEQFQKKYFLSYNKFIAVSFNMSKVLISSFSVTAILYFYVYGGITSNIALLFMILISTIGLVLYFLTLPRNAVASTKHYLIIVYIIIIHQFYMIAFRIYMFSDILINTVFWTIILLLLIVVKNIIKNVNIPYISNNYFKVIIYILVLVSFGNSKPRLEYNVELRKDFFIHNYAILVEEEPTELSLITVKEYFERFYIYENHIQMEIHDEYWNRSIVLLENEYINLDATFYFADDGYRLETIDIKDGMYHHVIFDIDDVTIEETYHSITAEKPEYRCSEEELTPDDDTYDVCALFGTVKPPEVYSANVVNDYIYLKTVVGIIIYDQNYNFVTHINHEDIIWNTYIVVSNDEVYIDSRHQRKDENRDYSYSYSLYEINDDFQLDLVYETSEFETHRDFVYEQDGQYYYATNNALYTYNIGEDDFYPFTSDETIKYIDNLRVVTKKHRVLNNFDSDSEKLYSNGYILIQDEYSYDIYVATVEDYSSGNEEAYIEIKHPKESNDSPKSIDGIRGFRASEDRFLLYLFGEVYSFDKKGNQIETVTFISFKDTRRVFMHNDILTTISASYYNELLGQNYTYKVIEIDPNNMSEELFRDWYTSYLNCDVVYGCDDFNPMWAKNYIYVQLFVSMTVIVLPSKKEMDVIDEIE